MTFLAVSSETFFLFDEFHWNLETPMIMIFNHYFHIINFQHLIYSETFITWNESFINSPKLIIWSQFWNLWTTFWCLSPYVKNSKIRLGNLWFFPLTPPPIKNFLEKFKIFSSWHQTLASSDFWDRASSKIF